jgi:hypothetical protein
MTLCILCVFCNIAFGAELLQGSIAIFSCKADNDVSVTEASFITERVTLEMLKLGSYTVLDKYEIQKRSGKHFTACDSSLDYSCYFSTGAQCAVTTVLWGKLSKSDKSIRLDLFSGEMATRKILSSVSTSIHGSTVELAEQIPSLLADMFGGQPSSPPSQGKKQTASALAKADTSKSGFETETSAKLLSLGVRSEPDGATVYLNGDSIGITPCKKDSLWDGTYTLVFNKYGYKKFSSDIYIKPGKDKKVFVKLEKLFGSLSVKSTPANATCSLTTQIKGKTPFTCDTLMPCNYSVNLSLNGYAPVTLYGIIESGKSDTINHTFISQKYLDSMRVLNAKRFQLGRRIVFGGGALGFFAAGIYYENAARSALDNQKKAYTTYSQLNSSNTLAEFDASYSDYEKYKQQTSKYSSQRNTLYTIAAIFLCGFGISIPF